MNFEQLGKNINSFLSSQKILDNLPDMFLYLDSEGFVKESNFQAKNNLGITENITINELFPDGLKAVRQSVKYKKSVLVENGKQNEFLELTASKIDRDYCVCIRDNTKIINDNIEKDGIEKFNNEKNAMIFKLQNEFKSPINSITGFCQGLVDGIAGEITEKQDKYLKIIQSNAYDLGEFTEKFLEFSYAESLQYESEYRKFDIVNEIKDILKKFEKNINKEKINIDFYYDGLDSRSVYNDLKAVKQVFTNIFETSLNSTESGSIQISLSNPDDETSITYGLDENKKYLQIKIKDTGKTLSDEDLRYICNPYAQLEKGRKQLVKSFRLGTASILIKRANGFFNINSDNGNLYSIIIPTEKEEDE